MFSTPTPSGSRALASNALKGAGLINEDAKMRDAPGDKPGGRKGTAKIRSHRPRPIDAFKDRGPTGSSSSKTLANRLAQASGQASSPIAIRGAGRGAAVVKRAGRSTAGGGPLTTTRISKGSIQPWRDLVNKRWDPTTRLLNLSSLADDEIVKQNDLRIPGLGGTAREADVLFKLASKLTPDVLSLDLSNNRFTGAYLSGIPRYLHKTANLCLQNNNIGTGELAGFGGGRKERMPHLRELILAGNPIREDAVAKGKADDHTRAIAAIFPSLNILDGHPIAKISFDAPGTAPPPAVITPPTATAFPQGMGPPLIAGVDGGLVAGFLMKFFALFDTQRAALAAVYHPSSTFSFNVNTSIPERARIQGLHRSLPNQSKLTWGNWLTSGKTGSRNLSRVQLSSNIEALESRLHIGGDDTTRAIAGLPSTKHDVSGPSEKFLIDCFPVPHGQDTALLLTVHGEFVELPQEGLRSFDRVFFLLPAPPGSIAKANGWDVIVLSDTWTIRAYSSPDGFKPGPLLVQAPSKQQAKDTRAQEKAEIIRVQAETTLLALPDDQKAALMSVDEQKRLLLLQVIGKARLTAKFAWDCLEQNAWDVDKAMQNFEAVKGTLGAGAFLM